MFVLSPYEFLLEKVRRGEVDPEDVDIEELVEEFRAYYKGLESSECLREAGRFLTAMSGLLRLKVLKFFPEEKKEKERKPKVQLSEVLEVLKEEEDLKWLYEYEAKVGRPKGRKDTKERQFYEPEPVPMHREFKVEEYKRVLEREDIGGDFEKLKAFLYRIEDRVERIRYLMAWLM